MRAQCLLHDKTIHTCWKGVAAGSRPLARCRPGRHPCSTLGGGGQQGRNEKLKYSRVTQTHFCCYLCVHAFLLWPAYIFSILNCIFWITRNLAPGDLIGKTRWVRNWWPESSAQTLETALLRELETVPREGRLCRARNRRGCFSSVSYWIAGVAGYYASHGLVKSAEWPGIWKQTEKQLILTASLLLKLGEFILFGLDFSTLWKLEATFLVIGKAKCLFISLVVPKAFLQWFLISRTLINHIAEGLVWVGRFSL